MTDLAVQIRGLGKTYPFFTLDGIDLEVPTGTIVGLIGAGGAGKSTTMRILMGLVRADRGTVRALGYDLSRDGVAARREMGFVSEDLCLYTSATLKWHIGWIRSMFGTWDPAYAEDLLRRFDLSPAQKIGGLSRGQRVKALLLLALARRPKLLVLDEPTAGLDPIARQEVLQALAEILADEERSVLFSSQNTLDVEQLSDHITFIDRGRVVASADKESLLESWRSIRLRLPAGGGLPEIPGLTRDGGSERIAVCKAYPYGPGLLDTLQAAGAEVESVDHMSLEEIFVAQVMREREEAGA